MLALRDTTERPEGIAAGTLKLADIEEEVIYKLATELLTNSAEREKMAKATNPNGEGNASHRITEAIRYYFKQTAQRPKDYMIG